VSLSTHLKELRYLQERDDPFLALFPHRFDYIYAPYPEPHHKPDWKTETRYPLSDRLIQQGAYLYGVRFGKHTQYCLLDIDIHSPYHPNRDTLAVSRLVAALEPLGLTAYLACQSSDSGGLHLYFPFEQPQPSWKLAAAVSALLTNQGFKLKPGYLEVFPNPKPYITSGLPTRFNAHRLPLQIGSWLLNAMFEPIWSDRLTFVQHWQFAQAKNDVSENVLERILKQARRKTYRVSNRAEKFLNDLNAEIELGWTGHGQTNRLLGRITLRTYIFHHVLSGGLPLFGQALIDEVVQIARSLPGYREWCQHQHELSDRVEEWVRCVENSHYFPYGLSKKTNSLSFESLNELTEPSRTSNWNQQQANTTRTKIQTAIATLLETNSLPAKITDRFQALTKFGVSGSSLYRHRDLWHPNWLNQKSMDHLNIVNSDPDSEHYSNLTCDPPVAAADDRLADPQHELNPDLRTDRLKDLTQNQTSIAYQYSLEQNQDQTLYSSTPFESAFSPSSADLEDLIQDQTQDQTTDQTIQTIDRTIDLSDLTNNLNDESTHPHKQKGKYSSLRTVQSCSILFNSCTSLLPTIGCNALSEADLTLFAQRSPVLKGCNGQGAVSLNGFQSGRCGEIKVARFNQGCLEMVIEQRLTEIDHAQDALMRTVEEGSQAHPPNPANGL
jgi:hypothetical protein